MNETLLWIVLLFCVTQSGSLSGLNLAVFSISRLRLEAAAGEGDQEAARVLRLRRDANLTLVTILWANVAINVLIAMLAESLLAGVLAFLFSTVAITFFGEIIPQAWFTRHAMKVVRTLAPLLHVYRILLWPVAWPTARLLDRVVGPEAIPWYREEELSAVLHAHAHAGDTDVGRVEAIGARNFLALDDLPVSREGEPLDPDTIIELPYEGGRPRFPAFRAERNDPFVQRIAASGKKWLVLVDETGEPRHVINSHQFLREILFGEADTDPLYFCHHPVLVRDPDEPIGNVIERLRVEPTYPGDDVIDVDLILLWTEQEKRVIAGTDLLGRLFRRITRKVAPA